jgi:hypothetical protein
VSSSLLGAIDMPDHGIPEKPIPSGDRRGFKNYGLSNFSIC